MVPSFRCGGGIARDIPSCNDTGTPIYHAILGPYQLVEPRMGRGIESA